jgi:hypothetical protein
MQDDPRRPGRYGMALCNQDGGRFYDQEWMTAEAAARRSQVLSITDLPLCQRCKKSVARLVSGGSGASGVTPR